MRVAVIGAGSFGTSLAHVLAGKGYEVRLWARDAQHVAAINDARENVRYLPGAKLPASLSATASLGEALQGTELVVAATPSHAARQVFATAAELIPPGVPVVTASK